MRKHFAKAIPQKVLDVVLSMSIIGGMACTGGLTVAAATALVTTSPVFTSVTVNGASYKVNNYTDSNCTTDYGGTFDSSKKVICTTTGTQLISNTVPVTSTLTFYKEFNYDTNQIFLDALYDTANASDTNRSLIHLYQAKLDSNGNLIQQSDLTYTKGAQVSDSELNIFNGNTGGTVTNPGTGKDKTFSVSFKGGIQYGTTYILVINKPFSITNKSAGFKYSIPCEVDIPFKTGEQPATPTVTSATITGGSSLHLDGLTMSSNLEYRIAADGKTYDNWVPFTYTNTSADIKLSSVVDASTDTTLEVGFAAGDGSNPSAVSSPIPITFNKGTPSFSDAILSGSGTTLTIEGLPKDELDLEYGIASGGTSYTGTWSDLTYSGTTATLNVTGITAGTSVVFVRRKADTVSYASDAASRTVIGARPSDYTTPPSISSAQLNGSILTLYGLPETTAVLEYSINGNWAPLKYTGTSAAVDVTGLSVGAGSKIEVRYAADNTHEPSQATACYVSYAITNASIPLTQGQSVSVAGNSVVIDPSVLASGTNTVAVRNASNETLESGDIPYKGMAANNESKIPSCGGIYGFTFKQASNASADDIKITIPYTLPESTGCIMENGTALTDSKVAIYMLSEFYGSDYEKAANQSWGYWKYLPTTIDSANHTATIDLKGDMTGKQVVLSVRYDVTVEDDNSISWYSNNTNTDNKSITLAIGLDDWSGYKDVTIIRRREDDLTKYKEIHLDTSDTSLNPAVNSQYNIQTVYYYKDTDVSAGVDYIYQIESATDNLGNVSNHTFGSGGYCVAYADTAADEGQRVQNQILQNLQNSEPANGNYFKFTGDAKDFEAQAAAGAKLYTPQFVFADGDSQNSVTSTFILPYCNGQNRIIVKSENPKVINIATGKTDLSGSEFPDDTFTTNQYAQVNPQKDSSGNPVDTTVSLDFYVVCNKPFADSTGKVISDSSAVFYFKMPVTVKWKTSGSSVEIGNNSVLGDYPYFQATGNNSRDAAGTPDYFVEINPLDDLVNALGLNGCSTINLDSPLVVDNLEGHYVGTGSGSFISGNKRHVVIDGHGKTLKLNFDGSMIKFDGNDVANQQYEITLKNFTIDMNSHNASLFSAVTPYLYANLDFENIKVINSQNSDYAIYAKSNFISDTDKTPVGITVNNCSFGSFKTAAAALINDGTVEVISSSKYTYNPTQLTVTNSTFNGGGKPGYGIVDQFGKATVKNSTFTGYTGEVMTGWNSSNRGYDYNKGFVFKGIPDGSPSAAILLQAWGNTNLSGDTINSNDNSVLAWSGETNLAYLTDIDDQPVGNPALNGITVKDTASAEQAAAGLCQVNNIILAGNSNRIVIQDASNPYSLTTLVSLPGNYTPVGGGNTPTNTIITGTTGSDGTTSAEITSGQTDTSTVGSVTVSLGSVTVTAPSSVFDNILGDDTSTLRLSQGATPATTQTLVASAASSNGILPINLLDIGLTRVSSSGSTEAVHQLSGSVTVVINLTDAQLSQIKRGLSPMLYYFDPDTGKLTDMKATFDLTAGTVTFATNHFSTYVIATSQSTVTKPIGVTYRAHVQNRSWLSFVSDGAQAGTEHQALRAEAVQIKLTGDVPVGASIVYQAHVQHSGWQSAVSNGATAGTTGQRLRLEALRITLKGLTGYAVKYRAYVQGEGWLNWQTTANGTNISKASIAGTTGHSLRLEAVEIEIVKVN